MISVKKKFEGHFQFNGHDIPFIQEFPQFNPEND